MEFYRVKGHIHEEFLHGSFSIIKKNSRAIFLFLALLILPCIFLGARNPVTIYIDGQPYMALKTNSRTVSELLQEMEMVLHPRDLISPAPEEILQRKTSVWIEKAFPVVITTMDSETEVWTTTLTVGELLRREGFYPGEYDRVFPEPGHNVQPHENVRIVKVEKEYVTERRTVPFQVVYRACSSMDRGLSRNVVSGADGLEELNILITYEDGYEVSREVVNVHTITPPQNRIVEQGANTILSRGGATLEFTRALYVTATAYCPGTPGSGCPLDHRGYAFCTGPALGYTRTGMKAVAGDGSRSNPHIIAVDPGVIPLRSLVYIEGYGFATAQDTGGAIKGNRIDLLFNLHEETARFGVRRLKVYALH